MNKRIIEFLRIAKFGQVISRHYPHLNRDAVARERLLKLLSDELRTGHYRTRELCEILGEQEHVKRSGRATLRHEFRCLGSPNHRQWARTLAGL